MARNYNEINITPSLLDRLLDYDPRESKESPKSRTASLQQLKASVRRDLEFLLNTRYALNEAVEELEETSNSMMLYGLPDFTGISIKSVHEQRGLVRRLENAIRLFEPRLVNLQVTLEPIDEIERSLRFRIEAQLKTDPIPEPVTFDTVLQMGSGSFDIKER